MESSAASAIASDIGRKLIDIYFKTNPYPYTRHHIDSYDQFLQKDLGLIIRGHNPIVILKDNIKDTPHYAYRIEINIGNSQTLQDGTVTPGIYIGTPTVALQDGEEVRVMYPAEARLRNLTYSATVYTDMHVKIIRTVMDKGLPITLPPTEIIEPRFPLFRIPIMLHSRYCVLHRKPKEFLEEVGECPYDHGGYFIINGGERIIVSKQEQAFNTLYCNLQEKDPHFTAYATITSFSPQTRITKRISFAVDRKSGAIKVSIPFVRMPIPIFVLFRALGIQPDQDIVETIFPDLTSPEAQTLLPLLLPSITDAYPFLTTYTAVQYMKTFTKGFSEAHVLDIIHNQLFIHVDNHPGARVQTLGNYIRQLLRLVAGIDKETDKDNVKNQRCLVTGFSTQMLFQGIYNLWIKAVSLAIDKEYNYQKNLYQGENFVNIFAAGNLNRMFAHTYITEALMRAFNGKWGTGLGEDKAGLIQVLSRLSYLDFMSHCRRVVLDFDTSMKLTGPRHLHPSQFGYFCTNETPSGSSIGITKNLSVLTMMSSGMPLPPFMSWLRKRRFIYQCDEVNATLRALYVAVELNGGIIGYTAQPERFVRVLQLLKRTGWMPPFVSSGFDRSRRKVFIYADEGRPMRPLVLVKGGKLPAVLVGLKTWRDGILGSDPERVQTPIETSDFTDPLAQVEVVTLDDYIGRLEVYEAPMEYVDPYEQNLAYVATYPEHIQVDTSHMEIHPSTMLSIVNGTIPFLNHNQSPRNQLGCSQSKQGVSLYCSNWKNRYDNQVHVLCYPQAPLVTTQYQRYFAEGRLNNGFNCIVAISTYAGYNQEDGIVMNADSVKRGMFRSICYRTYEAFEENDKGIKVRFANPREVAGWNDIRPNLDYSKLDERGFIRVGEYIDEETVIAGRYSMAGGSFRDTSVTPQVWTRGRVDDIAIIVGANGLRTIKIRVVQDRSPEIGDKFTNRHGQKGTIGMLVRADNLPRTADGVVPDFIMNPHAIPSRMTIAQIMEQLLGKSATLCGYMGDGTPFTNEGSPADRLGNILESMGAERYGNEILYNGVTGEQMPVHIFMCPLYNMRLKHMVEDKWNARGEGRREIRTHQPTGGRGNQGGLKIGELERDSIICHGTTEFLSESLMKRSDGTTMVICNGCGRFPVYNERLGIKVCPTCDGPVKYSGDTSKTLEILPPLHQSRVEFSTVEAPFVMRLLSQEMETFMNMPLRFLTTKDVSKLKRPEIDPLIEGPAELPTLPELYLADERNVEIIEEEAQAQQAQAQEMPIEQQEELGVPVPKEMLVEEEPKPALVSSVPSMPSEPEPASLEPASLESAPLEPASLESAALESESEAPTDQEVIANMEGVRTEPTEAMTNMEVIQNEVQIPEPSPMQFNNTSMSTNATTGSTPFPEMLMPIPTNQRLPEPIQIQPGQLLTSEVPGIPNTFVVNTDMAPQTKSVSFTNNYQSNNGEGPRPPRSLRANRSQEDGAPQTISPLTKVTVNKVG
jgi:DNA-directed RNA polymerase II subunit RPB2